MAHASTRFDLARLDYTRIGGQAAAIAVNLAILMALLKPLPLPPLETSEEVIEFDFLQPKPKPEKREVVDMREKPVERPRDTPPARLPRADTKAETAPVLVPDGDPAPEAVTGDTSPDTVASGPADISPPEGPLQGATLRYASAPPPPYPREALRAGLSGTVLLDVLVDVDGRPLDVRIVQSSGHRVLDMAARRHVLARWRFEPAMRDGQPVQALGRVPVDFRLE